jgi:2'-5' RNA ligase
MQLDFGFPRMEMPSRGISARAAASRSPAAQQFEFYGFDRHHQHTYFFAVFADPPAADAVGVLRRDLSARSGLTNKGADASRLHMSLLCLVKQSARPLPVEAEEAALDAARFVRLEPFDIGLDRAMTFGRAAEGSDAKRPIVLTTSDTSGIRGLYERLHGVLERARIIGGKLRPFTPHMTMLYDTKIIDEQIAPISWSVREFHLVHSLHGKSQYRIVGSFPLRG